MKFSGYQAKVQLNTAAPRVQVPGNAMAYGTGGAEAQAIAKGLGQISAVAEKKQQESDEQDLLDARNKIMTSLTQQMYNSDNGFMTTGYGQNSRGLTDRVTEAVRTTFDDVSKNYNGRVQNALRKTMKENFDNFQRIAASRESAEAVKLKTTTIQANIDNGAELCGLNYANKDMLKLQVAEGRRLVDAYGVSAGLPGEAIAAKSRQVTTQYVGAAIKSAYDENNMQVATDLLNEYRKDMDQKEWRQLNKIVNDKNDKLITYNEAQRIYEETGGDIYAAREMAIAAATSESGSLDVDKMDKIMARVNMFAAEEKKAERQGARAARQRIESDVAQLDTAAALEDYRIEHEDEWSEDEKYWFGMVTDLQERMYNAARRGYKDKNAIADEKKLKKFQLTLQNGGKLSASSWVDIEYAAENLVENGRLSPAAMEDLYVYGSDEEVQSKLTEKVEQLGVAGGYNYLVAKGAEPEAAAVMIARVQDVYKSFDSDLDFRTDEEKAQDMLDELNN